MERALTRSGSEAPVHGYSRASVEQFVAAAASERSRLEAAVGEHEERTRRARAALGTHRVMVAMLLEAQRELDDIRARAEAEATAIMLNGEREAETVGGRAAPAVLDLTGPEEAFARMPESHPTPSWAFASPPADDVDAGSADYFDFLRGALVDDEPLGPRPE